MPGIVELLIAGRLGLARRVPIGSCRAKARYAERTWTEQLLYLQHLDRTRKSRQNPELVHRRGSDLRPFKDIRSYRYESGTSSWILSGHASNQPGGLVSGSLLRLISWAIDWGLGAGQDKRIYRMLDCLETTFGSQARTIVLCLQGVNSKGLESLLEHPWVQRTFLLTHTQPPEDQYHETRGTGFVMKERTWSAARFFNIMLISRDLSLLSAFLVPFEYGHESVDGAHAVLIDIPVLPQASDVMYKPSATRALRLCTAELERGGKNIAKDRRSIQLSLISEFLKGKGGPDHSYTVTAGILSGDMHESRESVCQATSHKAAGVDLRDAWEETVKAPRTIGQGGKEEMFGRERRNTVGHQSNKYPAEYVKRHTQHRRRDDKFLYTGAIETCALEGMGDRTGNVSRLGTGSGTDTEVCFLTPRNCFCGESGCDTKEQGRQIHGDDSVFEKKRKRKKKKVNLDASEDFGIAIGIMVR